MRFLKNLQLFLRPQQIENTRTAELVEIENILSVSPGIRALYEQVLKDVTGGKSNKGAEGLSAEQIVKLGFLRIRYDSSYRYLSEQTEDSISMRAFLNLAPGQRLSKSAINANLKMVKESTWKQLNDCLLQFAKDKDFEDGKKVRGDTTATETNIHYPTDARLLYDSVRVLTRIMNRLKCWTEVSFVSADHSSRAKKKLFLINNCRKPRKRQDAYLDIIRVARNTFNYAEQALPILAKYKPKTLEEIVRFGKLESELKHYLPLVKQVIHQARQRIIYKQEVPAAQKIVSIFEPHTDIIAKGKRDVVFGHKLLLSTGKSSLIFNLSVLEGNPADSTLVESLLAEHEKLYGFAPDELALDGCFGSAKNRDSCKKQGVTELTFSKNRNLDLRTLTSSKKVNRSLKNFRAGIEGCISFLKRIFGLSRIFDRGKETFKAVAQCATVAYNLILLARLQIKSNAASA